MVVGKRLVIVTGVLAGSVVIPRVWYGSGDPHYIVGNSSQPPAGATGAPGEITCAQCHSGGSFSGPIYLIVNGTETLWQAMDTFRYQRDSLYTFQLEVHTGAQRFGFELTALDRMGNRAGSFLVTDAQRTVLLSAVINGASREYIAHRNANAQSVWSFQWRAPSWGDSVFVYLAVNSANNNGATSGDAIHVLRFLFLPDSLTGVDTPITQISEFPAQYGLSVRYAEVRLYTLDGRLLCRAQNVPAYMVEWYLMRVRARGDVDRGPWLLWLQPMEGGEPIIVRWVFASW